MLVFVKRFEVRIVNLQSSVPHAACIFRLSLRLCLFFICLAKMTTRRDEIRSQLHEERVRCPRDGHDRQGQRDPVAEVSFVEGGYLVFSH